MADRGCGAYVKRMGWLKKLLGAEPSGALPVSVNDDNFDAEVLGSELPVIVDVWSPTCAPCKQLEPVMMHLTRTYAGRVKVCEMNVVNGSRAAARFGVRGTPTVLYFDHGKEVERIVGFRSSLYHEEAIADVFGAPSKAADA